MTDLPDGTLYGRLTGRVGAFIGDTPGDENDLPDRVPTGGRVTVTPSITHVIHKPTGDVIFATPDPIDLDDDGHFEVTLVAVDSPDLNPTGWYYTVRVDVPGRAALTAQVQIFEGQTVTLGEAIGAAQPGVSTAVVKGDRGPKGDPGPPGKDGTSPAAPVFTASASTLSAGSAATAAVSGTYPNLALTFGIPRGVDGAGGSGTGQTAYEMRGTGSPYGVITPPAAGVYYTDTAGTMGAWRWIATGTTNTSWVVVHGDTGWRRITADQPAAWSSLIVLARWEPGILRLIIDGLLDAGASRWDVPLDYSTPSQFFVPLKGAEGWVLPNGRFRIDRTGGEARGQVTIPSPRWPTTLPGTPA